MKRASTTKDKRAAMRQEEAETWTHQEKNIAVLVSHNWQELQRYGTFS